MGATCTLGEDGFIAAEDFIEYAEMLLYEPADLGFDVALEKCKALLGSMQTAAGDEGRASASAMFESCAPFVGPRTVRPLASALALAVRA